MDGPFRSFLHAGALAGLVLLDAASLTAQTAGRGRPFEILDNSFLVEEAFNQEAGVFQNILVIRRSDSDGWSLEFTQEWPVRSQRHQLSYTVPYVSSGASGLGDLVLNYRYQALLETDRRPAFSPRVSVILATGKEGIGGDPGVQVNLPVSKQAGDIYLHGNAGGTAFLADDDPVPGGDAEVAEEGAFNLGGSVIWRLRPLFHLMVESVAEFRKLDSGDAGWETAWLVSPGFRAARNFGDHQLVLGAALPLGLTDPAGDEQFLLYVSYELPFRR